MRAAVLHGRRDLRIDELSRPAPGAGELLLRITVTGICGTDAAEYGDGPDMFPIEVPSPITGHHGPMVPGHELAGEVVETGPGVTGFAVGDLVVSGAGISCGDCAMCRQDRTNLCATYSSVGLQRNGGLAQYCAVPASTCLGVARYGVSGDTAGLAQPMAIAVHAVGRGQLRRGEKALIIGAGGIGAFATWVARSSGAHVTVCDLDERRLASATSLGADEVVRLEQAGSLEALLEKGPWSVVYEVSGSGGGLRAAMAGVATGGRIVVVGLQHDAVPADFRRLALSEITITGTNAHVYAHDLPVALELLAARNDGWADIAPEVLPLDEVGPRGLEPMASCLPVPIKVLVDPWAGEARPFG